MSRARACLVVLIAVAVGGTAVRAAAPGCPRTFAKASGPCDPAKSPSGRGCVYAQGTCACQSVAPCSGVPRPPGEPAWTCKARRTDGCPDDAPAQGRKCTTAGKTCSYGTCGALTYTCDARKRTWFISGATAPPPSTPATKASPEWKQCPPDLQFGCQPRSQGIAPAYGETVPQVCGCRPSCGSSLELIAQQDDGKWPDGSLKGRFTCAPGGIP